MSRTLFLPLLLVTLAAAANFLAVDKATKTFTLGGKRVFLSGANQPWINYGDDFGNNQTNGKICALRSYVANLTKAGGNSMRIWLFIEGDSIPEFDSSGSVTATDGAGTLIDELRSYAQYAAANNVFIHLCLWNGAVLRNNNTISLFTDEQKLDSFIQNALTPMVKGLANEPGIGSYEIMNEVRTHFARAIPAVLSFPRSLCRSVKARSRSPRILIRASTQKPSSAALVPAGLATTSQ